MTAKGSDPVTGLAGSGAMHASLEVAVRESAEGVALAVLDIDRFGEINSELGPEAGDGVLLAVAALLQQEASQTPGAAALRVSGDEFALVLPELSLEQAFLRMERLRSIVEGSAAQMPGSRTVTVTIGVAQYPRDARNAAELLKAADAAMMAAKDQGRNAVGLPPNEEMVMKSCYYAAAPVRKLKLLAERLARKESVLLREALTDLLRKYDTP